MEQQVFKPNNFIHTIDVLDEIRLLLKVGITDIIMRTEPSYYQYQTVTDKSIGEYWAELNERFQGRLISADEKLIVLKYKNDTEFPNYIYG